MEKLILKKLRINDSEVLFNNETNYIVGLNGSGKTILFRLIQYALGLRNSFSRDSYFLSPDTQIECLFGDKSVVIQRTSGSNQIHFSGDLEAKTSGNNQLLYQVYNDLLKPTFSVGGDETAAVQILRNCFISQDMLPQPSMSYTDNLKKVLGLNIALLKNSKTEIEVLKQESQLQEFAFELLKKYVNRVDNALHDEYKDDFTEKDSMNLMKVLKKEYMNLYEINFENNKLLYDAIHAYEKLKKHIEESFVKKINELERHFYELALKVGIKTSDTLLDFLNSMNRVRRFHSHGEGFLLRYILLLFLVKPIDMININCSSLIVVDSLLSPIDLQARNSLRQLATDEFKKSGIQYIEFCDPNENIPSSQIVLNLDVKEASNWLLKN